MADRRLRPRQSPGTAEVDPQLPVAFGCSEADARLAASLLSAVKRPQFWSLCRMRLELVQGEYRQETGFISGILRPTAGHLCHGGGKRYAV